MSVEALEDRLEVVSDDEERGGLEARRDMLVEKVSLPSIVVAACHIVRSNPVLYRSMIMSSL